MPETIEGAEMLMNGHWTSWVRHEYQSQATDALADPCNRAGQHRLAAAWWSAEQNASRWSHSGALVDLGMQERHSNELEDALDAGLDAAHFGEASRRRRAIFGGLLPLGHGTIGRLRLAL